MYILKTGNIQKYFLIDNLNNAIMKFEIGGDFSKILFGDDISREIIPRGQTSEKSSPSNLGTISPALISEITCTTSRTTRHKFMKTWTSSQFSKNLKQYQCLYLSSLPVAHLSDAPRRLLVVMGNNARTQDETTESSAWFFNVLCV